MRRTIVIGAFLVLILLVFISSGSSPAVWVEIHDASPAYGAGELSKVVGVLEKHDVERAVIFVIPNHGGKMPLSEYPEFSDYLKELENDGYEIGMHGYTHTGFEFYCSKEEAAERMNSGMAEFQLAGINPHVFVPPRFFVKKESFTVLEEGFEEVYLINKISKDGKEKQSFIHEFTWFRLPKWLVMPVAKASYASSRGDVYRLSMHIGKMDDRQLEFLDEFLDYTDSKRINIDGGQEMADGNR